MRHEILKQIKTVLEENFDEETNNMEETDTFQKWNVDSLMLMSLTVELEEKYDFEIGFEESLTLDYTNMTIKKLIDIVIDKIQPQLS